MFNPETLSPEPGVTELQIVPDVPKAPFLIRGHHLFHVQQVVRYVPHAESEDNYAFKVVTAVQETNVPPTYPSDVLGNTHTQAEGFRSGVSLYFKRFLDLQADDPIRIVAGELDSICLSCAVGQHCISDSINANANVNKDNSVLPPGVTNDASYIRMFLDWATDLGVTEQIRPISTRFGESSFQNPTGIEAPAQVVKQVLASKERFPLIK